MRQSRYIALVLGLALAAPVFAGEKSVEPSSAAVPAPTADLDRWKVDPAYVLGSDDIINVSVWHEPDVSATVTVRPDGKVTLPLLGDVQAAGSSPSALAASLREKLANYINDPQVTVTVTAVNSQRYYIIGEVGHPGTFALPPNTSVLQALANAGAFSAFANVSKIYVLRRENGTERKFPFNYRQVLKGKMLEQNIVLKSGDTIVVP